MWIFMNYYNNKSEIKIFEKSDITKRYDNHRRAYKEIENFLLNNSVNGEMLITMGCGNVDLIADALVASDLCTSSTSKTL